MRAWGWASDTGSPTRVPTIVNHPSLTKSARHGHGREKAEWRVESTCQTRNGQSEALECSLPCVPRQCASQDIKGLCFGPKVAVRTAHGARPVRGPSFFPTGAFPAALRLEQTPWPPFVLFAPPSCCSCLPDRLPVRSTSSSPTTETIDRKGSYRVYIMTPAPSCPSHRGVSTTNHRRRSTTSVIAR